MRLREAAMNQHFNPSRRDILRGGSALIVGFSLASPMCEAFAPAGSAPKPLALTEVDSFLAIDSKGTCTVYSGKVDLGTGVATALRQIAADELDLPFDRVNLVEGDTALTPDQGTTWGSLSIQVGGAQIRQASAAARAALLDDAARRLGTARDALTVADGIISGGGRRVSYGELVGGRRFSITLDPKQPVTTKDPKDFKVVGKPVPRIDIPSKIT